MSETEAMEPSQIKKSVRLPGASLNPAQRLAVSEQVVDPNKPLIDAGWQVEKTSHDKNVFVSPDGKKEVHQTLTEQGVPIRSEYRHLK